MMTDSICAYIHIPSALIEDPAVFFRGISVLELMGVRVINPDFVFELPDPCQKAQQLMDAFANPKVDLILTLRGGYGAVKMLPFLDFDLIRANPKPYIGFSDVSILLNILAQRSGIVTYHGPMVSTFARAGCHTLQSFIRHGLAASGSDLFYQARLRVLMPGCGEGRLIGGNLSVLTSLFGTEWDIDTNGSILMLEDVGEALYRIDRLITQWIFAGKFRHIKGLILGHFDHVQFEQVFDIIKSGMNVDFPVIASRQIGHGATNLTLPIGQMVRLDTAAKRLEVV